MPVTQDFLDKYNQTNISEYRLLGQADKNTADIFFGNTCDNPGTAYTTMDAMDAAQNLALNKYAVWDYLYSTRLQTRL